MKLHSETTLRDFDAWSGAIDTKNRIIEEGKEDDFDAMMEELYPDGLTDTQLNDILWFEEEWIYDNLGISDEEEDIETTCPCCGWSESSLLEDSEEIRECHRCGAEWEQSTGDVTLDPYEDENN